MTDRADATDGPSADGSPSDPPRAGDAASALRRSEAAFRLLIERSPDAIAVYGTDGLLVYVNDRSVDLLGYERADQLVGRAALDLVDVADRPLVAGRIESMLRTGQPVPPREFRMRRADGSACFVESTSLPVDFGGARSILTIVRDVGERKALEAKVMQVDRMIAVGTLAEGVAHEVNNPLQTVTADLDVVAGELPRLALAARELAEVPVDELRARADALGRGLDELRPLVAEMQEGAGRVGAIVRALRTFGRPVDDRAEPIELARVVDNAIAFAWNEIRHRARLVKRFDVVPTMTGNAARIGHVVLNLLVNAAQAIPEGHASDNEIRVRVLVDGGRACVDITDTGTGIREDVLPRIFDPFFTTKPVGHGAGLGLSIARNLLRDMGGEIEVATEVGVGSTFRVALPIVTPAAAAPAPVRAPAPSPAPAGRRRVLVVDDEPYVRAALRRVLGVEHDCVVAPGGREALELLRAGAGFDLILSDLMMPEMSGMQLFEAIVRERPDLADRVVFVTGGAFTPEAREFLDRVPNRRLDKPVDVTALRALLREGPR